MATRRKGRGGKGGAEPTLRIRLREQQALQMHLEGQSQHSIAAALDVTQAAVSKILKRIEERLHADLARSYERQRARQLLRLEHLYAVAMKAWQQSVSTESIRRRQRKSDGSGGTGTVAEIVSESAAGDPRYLEQGRRVLEDLRNLLGLDAPRAMALDVTAPYQSLSDEAVMAELLKRQVLMKRLEAPVDGSPSKEPNGDVP